MLEHNRQQAQDQLAMLAVVNRAQAGGDDYNKLAKRLSRRAGNKD